MALVTGTEIRDFRIRGNYFNQRSLLSRRDLLSLKERRRVPTASWIFSSRGGVRTSGRRRATGSIVVREIDIPLLCQDDFEKAKRHLSLILSAQSRATPKPTRIFLRRSARTPRGLAGGSERAQPTESRFVVPSTSCETHSEQDISHKGSILLKLSQLGYPVPDFAVLTSQAYADRAQHLEEHLADAIQQLEILTMQSLGDSARTLWCSPSAAPRLTTFRESWTLILNVGVTESTLPA